MRIDEYLNGEISKDIMVDAINASASASEIGITDEELEAVKTNGNIDELLSSYAKKRIETLIDDLNKASDAYYNGPEEIMSNYEYDAKYDELLSLEARFGIVLENSPTKNVGYEVKSDLKKEVHEYKALSLDKTKDRDELVKWLGDKEGSLGWKLDGLTVQLTYDDGKLTKAVTRGNGEVGENITHNAKYFKGVPELIPFKGHLVVRGEALITYSQFEKINKTLPAEEQYKNPRNLASGSVRQLDAKEAAYRHIEYQAFELVYAEGEPYITKAYPTDTFLGRFAWLSDQGFDVVEHHKVTKDTLKAMIEKMEKQVEQNDFPSDGLVLSYDDVAYGKSLGMTGKFPKHSIAFKWADETAETTLLDVKWQASRTGLINPVAEFEPVELEGTTVRRATAFNVSMVEKLKLGKGSVISIYKANKIIPKIAENVMPAGKVEILEYCPVCGSKTVIKENVNNGQIVRTLHCVNPDCLAKHIGKLAHFVERDRMNIVGLSDSTIETLVDEGIIREFRDIYHLSEKEEEFTALEGQGKKSFDKLVKAIEASRKVKLENLIAALGIEGIGRDAGKKISKELKGSLEAFNDRLEHGDFTSIDGVGEISNEAILSWYRKQKEDNKTGKSEYFNLLKEIEIVKPEEEAEAEAVAGKTFVITGDLHIYGNRNALIAKIESLGGKVSGSVSKKTNYLINNDVTSQSSKNKKAMELGIPIISEKNFQNII